MDYQFNYFYISLYIAFMSVCIVILVTGLVKPNRIRRNVYFIMLCLFTIGWFAIELAGALSGTADGFNRAFSTGLVLLGFAAATIFFFAISFYRLSIDPPLIVKILIYVFPVITAFFALVPAFSGMISDFAEIPTSMPVLIQYLGPWFWVHTIYSYFFILLSVGLVTFGHVLIPKFYRFPSSLLVFAVCLIPVVHILAFTGLWTINVPPFALAFCAAVVLANFALANNDENVFIRYARGSVFQYLNDYILVLGKNGSVVDTNPSASALFESLGINPTAGSLQDIIDTLTEKGAIIKPGKGVRDSSDIYITSGEFPMVLNLLVHEISDAKTQKIGSIAILTDVTGNRVFLDMLEKRAGLDPLTGLANRSSYLGARNRLDTSDYLPLSVAICDINGLKTVNDTLGHKHGDQMIRMIAKVLETKCPEAGFLARIGGDEFIILLPRTDEQISGRLIKQIREGLQDESKGSHYDLSLAMGAATKYSAEQDLDEVIDQADKLMYEDKKRIKN